VRQRVVFKIATLVHRSLSGNAPGYLADDCQLLADAGCQTTNCVLTFEHCSQLDAQQFWRQDLCHRRTTSLEQSAAQSQTMWVVIRPVDAVAEDIFYLDSEAAAQCELFLLRQIEIFSLTYLLTLKPQSYGPLYSNTVIGALAVDRWTVTFWYSEEGPGRPVDLYIWLRGTVGRTSVFDRLTFPVLRSTCC